MMRNRYGSIVKILGDVLIFMKHKNLKIATFWAIFTGFGRAGKIIEQHVRELSEYFKVAVCTLDANMDSPNHVTSEVIWPSKNIPLHMVYMLLFPLNFISLIRYNRLFRNCNPTIIEIKKVQ